MKKKEEKLTQISKESTTGGEFTKRVSSIELLRIIAMLMIVCSHYMSHGATDYFNQSSMSFNKIMWYIFHVGNLGTNIYVLISGYFLCKQNFSVKKIIKLYLQVFFYSIAIYIILLLIGETKFNVKDFINVIFPFTFSSYWFITCYIILLMLYPFINILINSLSRKKFKLLLIILSFLWIFLPTLTYRNLYSNEFTLFIILYLFGAYIRIYDIDFLKKRKKLVNKLLIFIIILYPLLSITLGYIGNYSSYILARSTYFTAKNSIFTVLYSIILFYYFSKKKFYSKTINKIGGYTFSIYLIHEHFLLRPIIWNKIFKVKEFVSSPYFFLHFITSVAIIFISCIIIEFIRYNIFEKNFSNKINDVGNFFDNKLKNIT